MERLIAAVRRVPVVVWSVAGLYVVVLVAYSILIPTYRAPDEPHHVDLARLFAEEGSYPAWDERRIDSGVMASLRWTRWSRRSEHLLESEAYLREARPSFEELEDPSIGRSINQLPQHPPLYYVLAGSFERGAELVVDDPSFDMEVWLYRLASVLVVLPLPFVIWRVAQRLRLPTAVGVAAMLVPLAIPQFIHIGSAVNNDNLVMLTFWLLTPVILRVADGELTPRVGILGGAITGLGMLTKGFAIVQPVWMLGALVVALGRGGWGRLRPVVTTGLWYGSVALAVGGWWWVRNLVLYGELSPSRFSSLVPDAEHVEVKLGRFLQTWATATTRRFWGDFGWFDVSVPSLAVGLATVVAVVGLVMGCRRRDRLSGSPALDRILLVAPVVMLVALQLAFAFRGYLHTGRMPGLQGRYWFGSLAALAVVAAVGLGSLARPLARALPWVVLAGVAGMQGAAVSAILGHYWGPPDGSFVDQLEVVVAWAPIQGELVTAGAVLGALVVGFAVIQIALALRRDNDDDPASDTSPAPSASAKVPSDALVSA